jgi:hypothetical protein
LSGCFFELKNAVMLDKINLRSILTLAVSNIPEHQAKVTHSKRDYFIAAFTFICVFIALTTDANALIEKQNALGVCAWVFLTGLLLGETAEVRVQVGIAIMFATLGEHFASPYMEGYIYRFHNVPAYVPPGHGMVYLTAVALARSGLFTAYGRQIAKFVILVCGLWSFWGISGIPDQGDAVGALLFSFFLLYLYKGRSPLVYVAAFFITTWLELIGTAAGTWRWSSIDPVLNLPQGNPPSGVAAWYCLVDAVALAGALPLMNALKISLERVKLAMSRIVSYQNSGSH